jgi:cytochrome c-type biogenesis protein CcmH/NrfG
VTNLVVASIYVPVSAFSAAGESWTYFFGLAVALEVIVLALVLRLAWTWPRTPSATAPKAQQLAQVKEQR